MTAQRVEDRPVTLLSIWVPGLPQPQGSSRAFVNRHTGRVIVTSANAKLKPWRQAVTDAASEEMGEREAYREPINVTLVFQMPRPAGHFGKKGLLPSAPSHPAVRPDLDKLTRAALDSLKAGGVYKDDGQVVSIAATKVYGERPGAYLQIWSVA